MEDMITLQAQQPKLSWRTERVKDLTSKIGSGVTPTGGAASYVDTGIPLLRSQNVHFDGLHLDDVAFITEEIHHEMANTRLQDHDVLLNITGASIGRCTYVPDNFGEGNVNQHVCIVRPLPCINFKYLAYFLSSPWGQDQVLSSFTGASRQGLSTKELGSIQVPLPTSSEQERIAAYLDESCAAIDAAVAAKRKQIEVLDNLIEETIRRAVTHGIDPDAELKESRIDWLTRIPKHWEVWQIKRRCTLMRGKFSHRPRNDPALYDGEYPFVQTGDVTAAQKYIRSYSQTLNELGFSVSKMFPKGTLVMSIAANVGDVAILDFEACFPDSMVGLVPGHKTSLDFLYYLMRAMKSVLLRSAVLTTQLNLNYVRIGTNYAPFPPKAEQEKIAEFLDLKIREVLKTKEILNEQIETLIAYRKSLIHECVTGQRRIAQSELIQTKAYA